MRFWWLTEDLAAADRCRRTAPTGKPLPRPFGAPGDRARCASETGGDDDPNDIFCRDKKAIVGCAQRKGHRRHGESGPDNTEDTADAGHGGELGSTARYRRGDAKKLGTTVW